MRQDRLPRAREDEGGFTLVELMVTVLIIAILIGIAIPTFLGARQEANDRGVQSNVRTAFVATRIYYNGTLAYTDSPTAMRAIEPSLSWTNSAITDSSPERSIGVSVVGDDTVVVVGRTRGGRCFYLKDTIGGVDGGTYYERKVDAAVSCPPPDGSFDWGPSWRST